jgi:hypothetical protein
MTLFFNIELLEQKTNSDPIYMLKALHNWFVKRRVPKNSKEKYKPLQISLKGSSYLLNPKDFFADKSTDIIWLIHYLKLAACRDYTLYTLYGIKYLDISFMPDLNIEAIKLNPILSITDNKIYFKYEEIIKNGTVIFKNQRQSSV